MKTIRIIIAIAILMAFAAAALADTNADIPEYTGNDVSELASTGIDNAEPVYNGNDLDVLLALVGAEYESGSSLNADPQVGVLMIVKRSSDSYEFLDEINPVQEMNKHSASFIERMSRNLPDLRLADYTLSSIWSDNFSLPAINADVFNTSGGSLSIMSILTDDVNALQGLQFIIDDGATTSSYSIPLELFKQYADGSGRGIDSIEGESSASGGATFTFLGMSVGGELVPAEGLREYPGIPAEGGNAIAIGLTIEKGGAAAAGNQFIYGQDARLIGQTLKAENGATLVNGNPQTATFATNGVIALNGEGIVDAALYSGDTNNPNASALAFAVEQSGDSGALQISGVSLTQLADAAFDPSQSVYYKSSVIIGGMPGAVMKCPNCENDVTVNLTGIASVEQLENAVHKASCGVAGHRVCDELSHDNAANCATVTGVQTGDFFDPEQSIYFSFWLGKDKVMMYCPICDDKVQINLKGITSIKQLEDAIHAADCGNAGHRICDEKEHKEPDCGVAGHCVSDELVHNKLPCNTHLKCVVPRNEWNSKHTIYACKAHFKCEDADADRHALMVCGNHYACAGGEGHDSKLACGDHYACAGGDHGKLPCGAHGYLCGGEDANAHALMGCGKHFACAGVGGHNAKHACGNHYACEAGDHSALSCGHNACGGGNHMALSCGHYACDGGDHTALPCGHNKCQGEYHGLLACGHYECQGGNHGSLRCGHYTCESGDHTALPCGHGKCQGGNHEFLACGHYACQGEYHGALPCGHYACESGVHAELPCGHYECAGGDHAVLPCGHYACESGNHKLLRCGHYECAGGYHAELPCGHYACESGNHKLLPCGHYECAGGDHAVLPCGHYACESGNHKLLPCGHYECQDGDHKLLPCGAHYKCQISQSEWNLHAAHACGKHYLCADKDASRHAPLYCKRHYACDPEAKSAIHSISCK